MAAMKLVGRISVAIDVDNFVEAGAHESTLANLLELIRRDYPNAELELTHRRDRQLVAERGARPRLPLRSVSDGHR